MLHPWQLDTTASIGAELPALPESTTPPAFAPSPFVKETSHSKSMLNLPSLSVGAFAKAASDHKLGGSSPQNSDTLSISEDDDEEEGDGEGPKSAKTFDMSFLSMNLPKFRFKVPGLKQSKSEANMAHLKTLGSQASEPVEESGTLIMSKSRHEGMHTQGAAGIPSVPSAGALDGMVRLHLIRTGVRREKGGGDGGDFLDLLPFACSAVHPGPLVLSS